nr:MAG TPA: Putative Head Tail Connector Protein [Caudoviricetes sp.]
MEYLTYPEYLKLGFDETDKFDELYKRAEMTVNLYIRNFYAYKDFESDFEPRKEAVKNAVAYQIYYLDRSGIITADEKQSLSSVTIGRTSVSYQNSSQSVSKGSKYNLSLDTENWLRMAGFGYSGVSYDR